MDLAAPFKSEVLRALITLFLPGTIALGPFVLILGYYVPDVSAFWTQHSHAFAVLFGMSVLAAGFIIDDLGSRIERYAWDSRLDKATQDLHTREWYEYLQLHIQDEIIAQRHIRQKVTQLKFELAMPPSLAIFWIGLAWLQVLHSIWSWIGFGLVTIAIAGGVVYLLWESHCTANVPSKTRTLLLEAVKNGPKGVFAAPSGSGGNAAEKKTGTGA